jgi:antitoxin component YwqK of YwqJK toxin-antitoxin module
MKYYLLLLILSITACKTGEVKFVAETYDNGDPKTVYYFKNKADMEQHPSDTTIGSLIALNKQLDLRQEQFYENGQKVNEGQFVNGLGSGIWNFYYQNGVLQARSRYEKGLSIDTVFCYQETGKLKRLVFDADKKRHYRHSIDFYEDGGKMLECYFYTDTLGNDNFEGPYREWHPNGQLKQEAILKSGNSTGIWKEWDENGALIKTSDKPFTFGKE